MNRRWLVGPGLAALWISGCADPCLDDGLSQVEGSDCAAASATDSVGDPSLSTSGPPIPVDPTTGSDSQDDDSFTGTMSTGETESESQTSMTTTETTTGETESSTESETESDTETDTDTDTGGGSTMYCVDADEDGFGDADDCVDVPEGEMPPDGSVPNDDDCDDGDPDTFPGAAPNDDALACMNDDDGDDWGDEAPPAGVDPGTDCIDDNVNAFPGAAPNDDALACMEDEDDDDWGDSDPPAGADPGTDCDDVDTMVPSPNACLVWCLDFDGDNYGDPLQCVIDPTPPAGYVGNDSDCDDSNADTFPGAAPNDDALACMRDEDGDDWGDDMPPAGVDVGTDCDDTNINAFPGSSPNDDAVACMEDEDGDDWGDENPPAGVDPGTDCDDQNVNAFPGSAPNDDALACMEDEDGDDWGDENPPPGVDPGSDCADDNANAFPGAAPNDDPNACMEDEDDDDWGDENPPAGVDPGTDCADDNANAFPGAAPNDDPDACMEDEDGDDWGDSVPPPGVDPGVDCDDQDPLVPIDVTGLPETCDEAELAAGSLGCEFHAIPLPHIETAQTIVFDVALSNPSTTQVASVLIEQFVAGAWSTVAGPFNIGVQSQQQVGLPLNGADTSGFFLGGTYRITSDIPIAAYQRSSQPFSTDASLLLPASTWGEDYDVLGWDGLSQLLDPGNEEYVAITARVDGTTVTITPTRNTIGAGGVPAGAIGVPFNLVLNEGEMAVVASLGNGGQIAQSLSGTRITADNPIAVFTGTECSYVPAGVTACDHLEEQLLPNANATQSYVASRVPVRNAGNPEPAIWQIYAVEAVNLTFDAAPQVTGLPAGGAALAAGASLTLSVSGNAANPGDFVVNADGNILLAQYMTGQNGGGGIGDPSMVQLPAFSQMLEDYAVGTYPGFAIHHLTVTRQVGEQVVLDGAAIPNGSFVPVGSDWEVARVVVAEGTHLLSSDEAFSVMATGYNNFDSYAYAGGLRTNDLVCTVPDGG